MGESFQSMGRMTGAAGFKRDSVASRGHGGAPDPGLTGFSYNDPTTPLMNPNRPGAAAGSTHTSQFGMDKPTDDHGSALKSHED